MKINKEIQRYQESILFGLSLRQMVFALLAIGVAVGAYFGLKPLIGAAEVGWVCMLAAFPFAMCGFFTYNGQLQNILHSDGVPHCTCGGLIKPDVVLYEEGLDQRTLRGAIEAIGAADVLIVGGTSLTVYPAAGLIDYYTGDKLVLINRDATPYDGQANLIFRDKIGEVLSAI